MPANLARSDWQMPQNPWQGRQNYCPPEQSREEVRGKLRLITSLSSEVNTKAALAFAARILDIPYARVFAIYYGKAQRIEVHEADRIRAYVAQAQHLIEERARINAEIRAFRAEAPASLVRLAPKPLPSLEEAAARLKRGLTKAFVIGAPALGCALSLVA